jgi:uncharacterized membrane-anchored protein
MSLLLRSTFAFLLLLSTQVFAQEEASDEGMTEEQFLQSLQYQSGNVAIKEAKASLKLKPGYRFLGQEDARSVLEDFWGNPPDESVLGLIIPDSAPLSDDHSWAVVVTYNDEGYVSDADANEIDYAEMLAQMKADTDEANAYRKEQGYESISLIGWAEKPRYDAASKRLYWAKELSFEGEENNTLNYDIRVLGRQGYLSLEAIADMGDLKRVNEGMKEILPMAQFDAGNTYAEHNPDTDKVAAYGLGALVAGGVAAKTGLLAKIGAILIAGKKVIVVAVLALFGFLGKLFMKKKDKNKTVE